jgi:hypothetical protein
MIVTLDNILGYLKRGENPVKKSRVFGNNTINQYKLLETLEIELSNKLIIVIPKNYVWDLASVPRFLWSLVPPDSDAEIAFLIHDYLYENKIVSRKFADNEMMIWSKKTNGTVNVSIKNIDNKVRYYGVKWFGRKAWDN